MSFARIVCEHHVPERDQEIAKLSSSVTSSSSGGSEPELTLVTLVLDAADTGGPAVPGPAGGSAARLAALLSGYVVATRGVPGCLNVDLCASLGVPGRFVVIEKWATPAHQAAHADSPVFEGLARSCQGLLAGPPQVDLLAAISAHDLA